MQLIAKVLPKSEHVAEAVEAIRGIISVTREEPGCLHFNVFTAKDGQVIYIDEAWSGPVAFQFHHDQAYTKAIIDLYGDWLAQPPELIELSPVEA